jgi:hypothetical protein
MKVAVILTGHMRCWRDVLPHFKEKVIDRYSPDVFIHTWNEEGWWIPGYTQNVKGYFEETPKVTYDDMKNFAPTSVVIEDWGDYNSLFEQRGTKYENFAHRPKNILSMFYKLHAGVQLMENHISKTGELYDLVIRMRPDMIFNQELPEFDSNIFYTLAHRNHLGNGTGDMIQVGNQFNMILFSKISCYLNNIYNVTNLLCPHMLSQQWITDVRLPWKEFHISKTLQHTPRGEYVEMDKIL